MNMPGLRTMMPAHVAAVLAAAVALGTGPETVAAQENPGILVSAEWLAEHRDDPGVHVVHVGMARMGGVPDYVTGAHALEYHDIAVERNDLITELAPVEDLVEAFRAAGVSNDSHVVVVGDPGHVSARVFMTLDYLGHGDRTSVLDGGSAAWKAAGGEVSAEPATPTRGDFEANVREDMLVTAEWIAERLDDPGVTLIDARPDDEYTGERPGRDFLRGGHIPGAYNLYWEDLTRDTSEEIATLVDLAEVEARFEEAGATMDGVVVNYCLIGMRASYTYMVSRYLGYDTKFYDASWNDWGRREGLPLVTGRDRR
ncbi:sulfurtransferase [Candidatus Palauibacter sp.]|uniref:sulfurtransferase n=1 Tax=Candidatus Palauibacter sp. TaxID=3101350 RepID=UPI003C6FE392